ncbi:MAG: hypothetical protein H6Q42_280 [Deltaproteobacteria bacterium]|jgi:hypothetical protein|nr:hypothetical protein [Deltaproteobacteria bacterium]
MKGSPFGRMVSCPGNKEMGIKHQLNWIRKFQICIVEKYEALRMNKAETVIHG